MQQRPPGQITVDIPPLPGSDAYDDGPSAVSPVKSIEGPAALGRKRGGVDATKVTLQGLLLVLVMALAAYPAIWVMILRHPREYTIGTGAYYSTFTASIIAVVVVSVFLCLDLAFKRLPRLTKRLFSYTKPGDDQLALFQQEKEEARWLRRLEHAALIRRYLALALALLVAVLMATVLMPADVDPAQKLLHRPWEYFYVRALHLLTIASSLLLTDKLVMQRIAIRFHSQFYADRLQRNAFLTAQVRKLRALFSAANRIEPEADDDWEEGSEEDCRLLAADVFRGLQRNDQTDRLGMRDFEGCLAPRVEAQRFFLLLDDAGNGDLTATDLAATLRRVHLEMQVLERSLVTNSRVIRRLETVLITLVAVVVAYIAVSFLMTSIVDTLSFVGASIIAAKFLFAKEVQDLFSGIVFVIITHPFDIGDDITVGKGGFHVEDIDLTVTTLKGPGGRLTYVSNAVLSEAKIGNLRRSGNMREMISLTVSGRTTKIQLAHFEDKLNAFLRQHPRDFDSDPVLLRNFCILSEQSLRFDTVAEHKSNFQDGTLRQLRMRLFLQAVRRALVECDMHLAAYEFVSA
jgi:small-conductance mechanosensitive channel